MELPMSSRIESLKKFLCDTVIAVSVVRSAIQKKRREGQRDREKVSVDGMKLQHWEMFGIVGSDVMMQQCREGDIKSTPLALMPISNKHLIGKNKGAFQQSNEENMTKESHPVRK